MYHKILTNPIQYCSKRGQAMRPKEDDYTREQLTRLIKKHHQTNSFTTHPQLSPRFRKSNKSNLSAQFVPRRLQERYGIIIVEITTGGSDPHSSSTCNRRGEPAARDKRDMTLYHMWCYMWPETELIRSFLF